MLVCNYNPNKTLIKEYLECITKEIDSLSTKYGNILLLEDFIVDINLRRKRCLLVCNYNPNKTLIKEYLACITKKMDSLSIKYDNVLLLEDFSSRPTEESMTTFC